MIRCSPNSSSPASSRASSSAVFPDWRGTDKPTRVAAHRPSCSTMAPDKTCSCHGSNTSPYAAHRSATSAAVPPAPDGTNSTDGVCAPRITPTSPPDAPLSRPEARHRQYRPTSPQSARAPPRDASTETQDHASTHTNHSPPPDGPAKRSDLLGGLHGQLRQRSKRPYRPLTDIACRTRRTKIGQHVRTTPRERLHMIN